MKSMAYELAYSDGFLAAIQRLDDLLCGKNAFQGFTKLQVEAFVRGALGVLRSDNTQRDLLMTEPDLRITCKLDKSKKKPLMTDFRIERR